MTRQARYLVGGLRSLSFPKIPSVGDLACDFPCYAGKQFPVSARKFPVRFGREFRRNHLMRSDGRRQSRRRQARSDRGDACQGATEGRERGVGRGQAAARQQLGIAGCRLRCSQRRTCLRRPCSSGCANRHLSRLEPGHRALGGRDGETSSRVRVGAGEGHPGSHAYCRGQAR